MGDMDVVVADALGPFRDFNAEALIAECARTGKHYIDLTGESDWLGNDIIPKYNYLASKTGACIIPSCGFDSVPSYVTPIRLVSVSPYMVYSQLAYFAA